MNSTHALPLMLASFLVLTGPLMGEEQSVSVVATSDGMQSEAVVTINGKEKRIKLDDPRIQVKVVDGKMEIRKGDEVDNPTDLGISDGWLERLSPEIRKKIKRLKDRMRDYLSADKNAKNRSEKAPAAKAKTKSPDEADKKE